MSEVGSSIYTAYFGVQINIQRNNMLQNTALRSEFALSEPNFTAGKLDNS